MTVPAGPPTETVDVLDVTEPPDAVVVPEPPAVTVDDTAVADAVFANDTLYDAAAKPANE